MKNLFYCSLSLSVLLGASSCAPLQASGNASGLTYITIEEHFDSAASYAPQESNPIYGILAKVMGDAYGKYISDIDEYRLPNMDKNNIGVQVLSNDPAPDALNDTELVKTINDQLATAISPHPTRFRGFCYLPMALPLDAATELERCVKDLGFVGALIDSHLGNMTFYDSTAYDHFWSMAEKLDVPIYLHPTYAASRDVIEPEGREFPNDGDYTEFAAAMLSAHGYGWHVDTGLAFLRIWLGGVFDRFPEVKIVLGHMGETLPYMLQRVSNNMGPVKGEGVTIKEAWARNVWVSTSGFFSLDPFTTLLRTTDVERILYSVDYPWATNEDGTKFMEELKTSGMVSNIEWEKIASGNAVKLLKLESVSDH